MNASSFEGDPLPVALANLFRKRCVTRYWQDHGVQVAIDLNVSGLTLDYLFEGVPKTHTFYATKYQVKDIDGFPVGIEGLDNDFQFANDHVDPDLPINSLVYGGGKKVQQHCENNGSIWLLNANNNR